MIHRYWTGDEPPPLEPWLSKCLRSLNPDMELREWHDDTLPRSIRTLADVHEDQVQSADRIRHRANIIRLALLAEYGGWWYDYDVVPLCPVSALPVPVVGAHGGLCNSFLGYPAGHPELAAALDAITAHPADDTARSTDVSGENFLQPILTAHRVSYPFDSSGQFIHGVFAVHLYNHQRSLCR